MQHPFLRVHQASTPCMLRPPGLAPSPTPTQPILPSTSMTRARSRA